MASIYRNVSVGFWSDPKMEELSPEDRYVMLYLLTNPLTNLCGCYEIGYTRIARETGYSVEAVKVIVQRLEGIGVVKYSESTREMLLVNWWKYNWTNSPKIVPPLTESIEGIKSEELRLLLIATFEDYKGIPYPYGIQKSAKSPVSVSVTDTVSVIESNDSIEENPQEVKPRKRFVKPTVSEIAQYISESGYSVDPQHFFDHYESNGWRVGKNPMKDWKAAVRTWASRSKPKKGVTLNDEDRFYASLV